MRKEYGKVLRSAFERQMKAKVPRFAAFKTKSMYVFPGERIFRWAATDSLHCFVIMVPSRKDTDEFTVEVGWSTHGRFPELGMRPSDSPSSDRVEFERDEFVCRMSELWTREDLWWQFSDFDPMDPVSQFQFITASANPVSAEEAREAVLPKVGDAIEKVLAYGVPYLEELVASKGDG
ncbi:MAG: hypothetical protein OER43_17585 [Gammaproteobacteria bacterium]|nr:hypothetical protein [Gammaproteobacteria bacterium]